MTATSLQSPPRGASPAPDAPHLDAAPVSGRRLRVVTVIDHLRGGGAERAAVEIARRLAVRHDLLLVGSREASDGAAATALRDEGLDVLTLDRTATRRVHEWGPLVRAMRRTPTDVLHTHLYHTNVWGPLLRRAGRATAFVAHEHTPFLRAGGVRRWGAEAAVNPLVVGPFADAVVVPSAWSHDALTHHERVPARKLRIIPNGAPTAPVLTADERAELRAELGLAADERAIVVSAMLRPEKGHATALRAFAAVHAAAPRTRLLIVGAGPVEDPAGTRPALEALAAELGIAGAVTFAGRREDVPRVLAACDVALLPSDHENLPLALLEYMAAGLPIVATAVGGVPTALADGAYGLLVPPRDPVAIAAALRRTLDEPSAAAERAAAAREHHRAHRTWDAVADAVEALYLGLLARSAR
ncbi:MAG: glycosyltransferase [Patulibacter sp.]|nr:glycosyltransferase [Patulibacter sp.]